MGKSIRNYNTIVVGGGIAGLTTAAYIAKAGQKVLLIEKEDLCGGFVNSFKHNGFIFDGGIRALENAGVLFPMLKQLGIKIDFVRNDVTVGIGEQVIPLENEDSLYEYESLLINNFPENKEEIQTIIAEMKKIAHYMDIQYGIDNPLFLDPITDANYFLKKVIPWMFKYGFAMKNVNALNVPVRTFLEKITSNQNLIDVIAQHFFTDTPAFFALSYLKLYLDYHYPIGGTGELSRTLVDLIQEYGGIIKTAVEIIAVNTENNYVIDGRGVRYGYQSLVWAADQISFYKAIDVSKITDPKTAQRASAKKMLHQDLKGNDSILTTFIEVDLSPDFFSEIASGHFFYTPTTHGESIAGPKPINVNKSDQKKWLRTFLANTTYEIAIPALRDHNLAPAGKTGLIVSVIFDYTLTKEIETNGWYPEFKIFCEQLMVNILNKHIFPGLKEKVSNTFSFTPISIEKKAGTFQGAITGWSFTNSTLPSESRLIRINNAVNTPFKNIFQAGMWTYTPSGFPVSLITGKLASDKVIRRS